MIRISEKSVQRLKFFYFNSAPQCERNDYIYKSNENVEWLDVVISRSSVFVYTLLLLGIFTSRPNYHRHLGEQKESKNDI